MKKVLLSLCLVAAMLLGMLAFTGCGAGPMPTFTMPEGGFNPDEQVTITFYHTMGANLREVLDLYIPEFEALYPNIKVEHQQIGGYDDVRKKISTQIHVHEHPNIAYCYPDHVALYNISGAVVTLDQLIESELEFTRADGTTEKLGLTEEQIDAFIDGYYDEGKQFGDGLMYTLPFSKSTEVLYYNKTFFDKHNLTPPTTWDELEALCETIKGLDPNCIPLGYDSEANWFITMCEQLGTGYTSNDPDNRFIFDNAENREFVTRFREWYQKGYVTTQEIYGTYTSSLFTATGEGEVRSYITIGSSAGATHQRPAANPDGSYPFEVGIVPIPQENPDNPKVISQGPSLCILQKENPQEVLASWLFMKFLTTNMEFQAEFSMASGYVPVLETVVEDTVYAKFLNKGNGTTQIAALSASVCMDQVDAYYTSPAFNGSSEARDQVGILMQKALATPTTDLNALLDQVFREALEKCKYNS
ncbi:MAG: extracellular solute-binding protein [Clostridia bacterium]|nr:extracellular solute-binding protein [Clostridia bacterium]